MMQRLCSWAIAIGVVAAATWGSPADAQQAFKSADEAANALIAAVRAGDAKTIAQVLGPDASEITSSRSVSAIRSRIADDFMTLVRSANSAA